jgi:hypothetical protein
MLQSFIRLKILVNSESLSGIDRETILDSSADVSGTTIVEPDVNRIRLRSAATVQVALGEVVHVGYLIRVDVSEETEIGTRFVDDGHGTSDRCLLDLIETGVVCSYKSSAYADDQEQGYHTYY